MGLLSKKILGMALVLLFGPELPIAKAIGPQHDQGAISYRQLQPLKVSQQITSGQARSASLDHGTAIEMTGPDQVCKNIMNATGSTLFVPANSLGEWQAFVNATIPGVTKGNCSAAPPPSPSGCGGVLVGGYCWYQSAQMESCAETCASRGGYNEATNTFAGAAGSDANCIAVASQFYGPPDQWYRKSLQDSSVPAPPTQPRMGCHYHRDVQSQSNCEVVDETDEGHQTIVCSYYPKISRLVGAPTTADAKASMYYSGRRFCACNN